MIFKRFWHSLRLYVILGSEKRADYLRKKKICAAIGKDVAIMNRIVPLYPNLIKIHNNVRIASNVSFITHDTTHHVLNRMGHSIKKSHQEVIGCIEICDNVFIGAGAKILYDTRIGPNAIVAAGSVVTKDVPPNTVVGGVPAKVLCSLETFLAKRGAETAYPAELKPSHQEVCPELAEWMWTDFYQTRVEKEDG
ncbi:MAG: acyltransferase [Firmicutes bacterium]|nr:acyltransferase [Bacillota bacterium]